MSPHILENVAVAVIKGNVIRNQALVHRSVHDASLIILNNDNGTFKVVKDRFAPTAKLEQQLKKVDLENYVANHLRALP